MLYARGIFEYVCMYGSVLHAYMQVKPRMRMYVYILNTQLDKKKEIVGVVSVVDVKCS